MPKLPKKGRQGMRLALRVEGNFWNAYAAEMHTMDGAILIGSLAMGVAEQPEFKQRFMDMMKDVLTVGFAEIGAPIETWNEPVAAPERERSGRA